MKKLLSVILIVVLISSFTCGCSDDFERILYEDTDFSKYVEVAQYKGVEIDTQSEKYAEFYSEVIMMDTINNEFYKDTDLNEGKVEEGDVANIDFTGKINGVAFEGGSAKNYDLEIGSNSLIPGFEEGLVGAEIGKNVDLNLTFPKDYGDEEFAGKAVVFTVTVNFVTRRIFEKPEDYFSKLNFKSVGDYNKDVRTRAIQNYLFDEVVTNSKIKGYPEKELNTLFEMSKKMVKLDYQVEFKDYLKTIGATEEEYKNNQVKPLMDAQLVLYAILDKEGMEFPLEKIDDKINKDFEKMQDVFESKEELIDIYGAYYEEDAVFEMVMDFIYKKAKLK